jgi:hypothetical protein
VNKKAYPDKWRWNELKTACKERAGLQCEYVYPNGKRCGMREDEIRKSKRRQGKPYVVYLHAAHLGNTNPGDPNPELMCLCPRHHMQMDRQIELREKLSTRRRGYQITTTDALLEEVNTTGITVEECPDGYTWRIDGTGLAGKKTTAVAAVGVAIHQMCCLLDMTRRELDAAKQQLKQFERERSAVHV